MTPTPKPTEWEKEMDEVEARARDEAKEPEPEDTALDTFWFKLPWSIIADAADQVADGRFNRVDLGRRNVIVYRVGELVRIDIKLKGGGDG